MATGKIYLVTNLLDGKYYVGQTIRDLRKRWNAHIRAALNGSRCHLQCAIRKYGAHSFTIEHIADEQGKSQLDQLERLWILILQSYKSEIGYNCTFGGEGGWFTPEIRARISKDRKGKPTPQFQTPESIAKCAASRKGSHLSLEHRQNIAKGLRSSGRIYLPKSEDLKRRIGESLKGAKNPNFGKERSAEHREKLRDALKGRQFSEETKAKMSASASAKYAKRRNAISGATLDLF